MAFKLNYQGGLAYLTIPAFEKTGLVKHGFSTRMGGMSKHPYDSLNLGLRKDDDKKNVIENYRLFCKALSINPNNLVASDQVHEDKIHVATLHDRGKGIFKQSDIKGIDALITKDRQLALVTYYADCVPLFLLDVETPAIGLAHAGWRGTVKKIGQKTVLKMMKEFGSKPEHILVGIGPCISVCCYEVDELVVDSLKKAFVYFDELIKETGKGKWKLDLVLTNRKQLEEVGINPQNITESGFCTSCRNDIFFSHRKDKGKTGSLAAVLQLI
ncbi:MAG: peptidoglycan editing factor PgeF [Tepidanaerobacteraceae bacterium]|jgi:YfiH family protein|nr:peptidoglycan editing factor PgeF [Tepidanaerobacter sp.]HQE05067.1 peptidoglycan editing factor PgeF [Tepidanaerobacteraceae bacterium]